ncbi:MAG: hypothetical protein ACPGWR_28450, partial [Ardenticatenaceae bacterium]
SRDACSTLMNKQGCVFYLNEQAGMRVLPKPPGTSKGEHQLWVKVRPFRANTQYTIRNTQYAIRNTKYTIRITQYAISRLCLLFS